MAGRSAHPLFKYAAANATINRMRWKSHGIPEWRGPLLAPGFLAMRHAIAMVVGILFTMADGTAALSEQRGGDGRLLGGEPCDLDEGEGGVVVAVLDGETLQLDTGLQVRLAGIAAPRTPLGQPGMTAWPMAVEAKAALEELALGEAVMLRYGSARRDRYGRARAQAFLLPEDGEPVWLQREMVAKGFARIEPGADDRKCAGDWIEAERDARRSGLGLWSDPYYAVRSASDTNLAQRRDNYDLVEGRILSVGERGPIIYLDFGFVWASDFTVVLSSETGSALAALGWPAVKLKGQRVRVRGWIEDHDGASLRVNYPEQLELLDDGE